MCKIQREDLNDQSLSNKKIIKKISLVFRYFFCSFEARKVTFVEFLFRLPFTYKWSSWNDSGLDFSICSLWSPMGPLHKRVFTDGSSKMAREQDAQALTTFLVLSGPLWFKEERPDSGRIFRFRMTMSLFLSPQRPSSRFHRTDCVLRTSLSPLLADLMLCCGLPDTASLPRIECLKTWLCLHCLQQLERGFEKTTNMHPSMYPGSKWSCQELYLLVF